MNLDHICILVNNLEKSISFYKQAFDCIEKKIQALPEYGITLASLSFPNSEVTLELIYSNNHLENKICSEFGHIGIKVEEIRDQHVKHQSIGLEVTEIENFVGIYDYYFVEDPDRYKIEIISS